MSPYTKMSRGCFVRGGGGDFVRIPYFDSVICQKKLSMPHMTC